MKKLLSEDWNSNKVRFCVEILAWIISISCSFTMAITVPTPPLHIIYPFWIAGCVMYAWAAYTRRSFGMLANYILLSTIDVIGFIRILIN